MRTPAIVNILAPAPLPFMRTAVVGLCLVLLSGCQSQNNPADLSATTWEAKTQIQDGKSTDLAAQKSELSLLRNGTFRWTKGSGTERRTLEGNYELSSGHQVVLTLKDEVEGSKTHVGELTLSQDKDQKPTKLVFSDSQGTIEFVPQK